MENFTENIENNCKEEYKWTLDENITIWKEIVINNPHVRSLPNIKKIVNGVCRSGDRNDMLKVHACIVYIRGIMDVTQICDSEQCGTCDSKPAFVQTLDSYIHKIRLRVNDY